jgi:hypothetical protein
VAGVVLTIVIIAIVGREPAAEKAPLFEPAKEPPKEPTVLRREAIKTVESDKVIERKHTWEFTDQEVTEILRRELWPAPPKGEASSWRNAYFGRTILTIKELVPCDEQGRPL